MLHHNKNESSNNDRFNENTINYIYDPKDDNYYQIRRGNADLSHSDYQRLLVIGHVNGGNLGALKWMRQSNYPLDVADDSGLTPLMIATKYGYEDIVLWLLSLKIDLNKVNKNGENAYQFALKNGRKEIANHIAMATLRNYEKQFNCEPFQSQMKKSSMFQDKMSCANKLLNGDNPYYSKLEMKENHKMLMLMADFIKTGNKELNITANPERANELFGGLIAYGCLYAVIMRVELLLGRVENSDDYFDLHPDLKGKDKKEKEIILLLNKISKLGYPHIANCLNKEYKKNFLMSKMHLTIPPYHQKYQI